MAREIVKKLGHPLQWADNISGLFLLTLEKLH